MATPIATRLEPRPSARASAGGDGSSARCCSSPPRSTTSIVRCSGSWRPICNGDRLVGLDYGRIVIAFQVSYAVMMLVWGGILDRIGTKVFGDRGGVVVAGRHGDRVAQIGDGLRLRALHARCRRGGQFPGLDQDRRRMVPEERARLRHRHLQLRHQHRCHRRAHHGPVARGGVGLARRVHPHGAIGFVWLAAWWAFYPLGADHPHIQPAERAFIDGADETSTAKVSLGEVLDHRQLWAFALGKMLTDPVWWFYLFWLPKFLASEHGMRHRADSVSDDRLSSRTSDRSSAATSRPR